MDEVNVPFVCFNVGDLNASMNAFNDADSSRSLL